MGGFLCPRRGPEWHEWQAGISAFSSAVTFKGIYEGGFMRRFFIILSIVAMGVSGCVSVNYTKLGNDDYNPIEPSTVIVYMDPSDVPGKFEKIGLLNSTGSSTFTDEKSLIDAMKEKAGQMGADAIILGTLEDADWFQKAVGAYLNVPTKRHGQAVAIRFLNPLGAYGGDNSGTAPGSTIPVYISQDGTREVKIFNSQAFLYDMVPEDNNHRATFLSDNVKMVKFLPDPKGNPPQVWALLNDGTTQTFDSKGNFVRGSGN
jgi:hypothetical protein